MEKGRWGHLSARAQRFSPEGCVWPSWGLEAWVRELASSLHVPTQKELPTVSGNFRMPMISSDNLAQIPPHIVSFCSLNFLICTMRQMGREDGIKLSLRLP